MVRDDMRERNEGKLSVFERSVWKRRKRNKKKKIELVNVSSYLSMALHTHWLTASSLYRLSIEIRCLIHKRLPEGVTGQVG